MKWQQKWSHIMNTRKHMNLLTRKTYLIEKVLWKYEPITNKTKTGWNKYDQTKGNNRSNYILLFMYTSFLWQNFILYHEHPQEYMLPSLYPALFIGAFRFPGHSSSSAFTDPLPKTWLGRGFIFTFGVSSNTIHLALINYMSFFLKASRVWMLCPAAPAWYSHVRLGLYQLG